MKLRFQLYLASQSDRRREFLKTMKVPFWVVPSAYRERPMKVRQPSDLARRHACGKARRAVVPSTARWILGADTIVVCGKRILGKPAHAAEAEQMLKFLAGKKHEVITAVTLFDRRKKHFVTRVVKTQVWIRRMSLAERRRYLEAVHAMDKAGGYAIQSGPRIVDQIRGSYTNVVGLPCEAVAEMLAKYCGRKITRLPRVRSGISVI